MDSSTLREDSQGTAGDRRRHINMLVSAVLIGVGLGLILLYGVSRLGETPAISAGLEEAPVRGSLAPTFRLNDISGREVDLAELRGKVVLVNFWATWCGPCRVEMPALQSRFEQHSPDLAVLAVDFDEPEELVREFATQFGLTFDVLLDPGAVIQQRYQIRGYPSSYFVDEEGVIQIVHIGIMSEGQLDGYLVEMGLGN